MKITGQCHCGEITYEAELAPDKVGICHCTDCQALSASAFRLIAIVAAGSFTLTHGTPRKYVKVGDSGNRRVQAFCGTCGSGIYASDDSDHPAAYNLRGGTIDQRRDLVPRFECWSRSALPWVETGCETRKFHRNPE